jgi:hypothetical protein
VYAAILVAVFVCGGLLGYRLAPGPRVREIPVETVRTQTVTKEVIREKGGSVVERTITKTENASKAGSTSAPAKQYRLGALLPIGEPKDVSVTAARRVVGNLWVESQYNIKRKEVLVGVSYEF